MSSNLVQQELTRLGINHREVRRQDHEGMENVRRLTITEKKEMRAVAIRSRYAERDCQSIVNQQVNSIKNDVVLRTSYIGHQLLISTQPARGANVELEPA